MFMLIMYYFAYLPKKDPRNSQWDSVTRLKSTEDNSGSCECAPKYTTYDYKIKHKQKMVKRLDVTQKKDY